MAFLSGTASGGRSQDAGGSRATVVALFLVGLLVNLTFGFLFRYRGSPFALEADEREYWDMAAALLDGTIPMVGRRTLAFPSLIAGIRLVTDDFRVVQIILTIIYSLSAPLLYLLVRRIAPIGHAALLSAVVFLLWAPAIYYGTSVYSETAALPVFLLALLLLPPGSRITNAPGRPQLGLALLAGMTLALGTHVRSMYLLFLPFLFVVLVIEEARWRVAAMRAVFAALGFFALILPWSAFVTQETGQAMLVTANGGETLGGGLNPMLLKIGTDGDFAVGDRTVWTGPGKWLPIASTGYLTSREQRLPYAQQDKLLTERTIDWARNHPVEVAQIEAAKVGYMWGVYGIERSGWRQALFGSLPTILLLVLAIGLTALQPMQGFVLARFWLLPVFVTGVALISWGSWRFRMPGDAGLIAYSAILGVRLLTTRRASQPAPR